MMAAITAIVVADSSDLMRELSYVEHGECCGEQRRHEQDHLVVGAPRRHR